MTEHLYRYEDEPTANGIHIALVTYPIIKQTPCGVWVRKHSKKRFILKDARKRFACSTKEEALVSFKARKANQCALLRRQLDHAERALRLAEVEDLSEDFNYEHPDQLL